MEQKIYKKDERLREQISFIPMNGLSKFEAFALLFFIFTHQPT